MTLLTLRKSEFLLFLPLLFFFYSGTISSQVVIGSGSTKPNTGSLLDLKEYDTNTSGANSSRGLLLPRVKLNKPDQLAPQGATFTGKEEHIGLMVYNLEEDPNKMLCKGIYIWQGTEWVYMHSKGCFCEYTIKGRDNHLYTIFCQDFNDELKKAEQVCKSIASSNSEAKYHLLTNDELNQIWDQPEISKGEYKFQTGTYFVNHKSWITLGEINFKTSIDILGVGFPFTGGVPMGGFLKDTQKQIIRCVRD